MKKSSGNKAIEQLANFPKETSGDEHGILKKLLNKIIFENNLEDKLAFLISRYERRTDISKKKSKSVVVKELTGPRISFKTFMFLIFEILRAKRVKICVEVEFSNKTTKHCIDVYPESVNLKDKNENKKDGEDT